MRRVEVEAVEINNEGRGSFPTATVFGLTVAYPLIKTITMGSTTVVVMACPLPKLYGRWTVSCFPTSWDCAMGAFVATIILLQRDK